MKRALVVKALTDQILLVRTDGGELLSLAVPCRRIPPGTMIVLDIQGTGCVIRSIAGKACKKACRRENQAMIIEHKDSMPSPAGLEGGDDRRHAI